MARTMQKEKEKAPAETRSGTPIWVWAIYALGIFGATVLVASGLFTLGAYVLANDVPVTARVSLPAILLWGGLVLVAAVVWIRRRRR